MKNLEVFLYFYLPSQGETLMKPAAATTKCSSLAVPRALADA